MRRQIVTAGAIACFGVMCLSIQSLPRRQGSGEAKVYRVQFIELHAKMQSYLAKAQKEVTAGLSPQDHVNLGRELLGLVKLAHRLGEEAATADLENTKAGRNSDKTLLLVAQGCEALGFTEMALENFVGTEDRAFLGLAKDGEAITKTIEKLL